MRRPALILGLVLALGLMASLGPVGAAIDVVPPVPGVSVTTDNVEHVGWLAETGPSVSARIIETEEDGRLFYLGSIKGFSIYNIDDPASPQLVGFLPIAGFQNEDLAVSDDGDIALLALGDANQSNYLIDARNRAMPELVTSFGGDHTLECANPECTHAYGSGGGTYHIRNEDGSPADGANVGSWRSAMLDQMDTGFSQNAHKVVRDAVGYVITDTIPRVMFDPRPHVGPDGFEYDAVYPRLITVGLAQGEAGPMQLRYQHNNLRPRAEAWEPRDEEELDHEGLRDGELLLFNGETNLTGTCGGNGGPFATMSVANFDRGQEMEVLETFRPVDNGTYTDGNPAVNVLGCSGHWFDWIDNPAAVGEEATEDDSLMVSAAWFEHGVRFLKVDTADGAIEEVGFFQPFNGSAGATYWIEHDDAYYVYVTDYVRGVDILRFDPDPEQRPDSEELTRSWLAGAERTTVLPQTVYEQTICRLAMQQ